MSIEGAQTNLVTLLPTFPTRPKQTGIATKIKYEHTTVADDHLLPAPLSQVQVRRTTGTVDAAGRCEAGCKCKCASQGMTHL